MKNIFRLQQNNQNCSNIDIYKNFNFLFSLIQMPIKKEVLSITYEKPYNTY